MVINSIIENTNISSVITTNQITKEQLELIKEQNGFKNTERINNIINNRLNAIQPEYKKKYILNEGLPNELIVKNRRLSTKRLYKCEKVLAFDTETYEGKCKLLACSGSKHILNPSFLDCIKFLFYLANNPNTYRFFYNLDFDITSILKLWKSKNSKVRDKWIFKKIQWLKDGIEIRYKQYILKWIKGRLFSIKHITRRKSVVFTDIFSFFKIGLNKSSKIYLKDVKINNIDGNLLNTSLDYWNKRKKDIISYCIQDSILTKRLGVLLIKSIEKVGLPLPKYLVSSASLSKQYFRNNGFISRISNVPESILQISYDCYFGGRFEMFKRGSFNNLYLYDIVSQYPSFIKNLLSLRDGLWKRTIIIPKDKCLGYFKVKVDIPKDYLIPTIPISHKGVNKFPNGIIEKWITWFDLDLIRDYIIEVKEGYIFCESALCKSNPKNNHKPFKEKIDLLFKKKLKLKGKSELDYNIVKLCMNAVYGCFIEIHKNYDVFGNFTLNSGILFNSVYASQITAFGRWSVIKDIPKDKYKNIIAIHTDSLISDIPLDNYLDIGKELGKWNLEKEGKGIILNTGMYQIGYLIKTRGIPKRFIINWLRFCLKNSNVEKKEFNIKHMRKLSEGLVRDKSLKYVNRIVDDKRSVNCNSDTKRDWITDFKNFNEVLTTNISSYPYYSFKDYNDLHPNPICIANRYENK